MMSLLGKNFFRVDQKLKNYHMPWQQQENKLILFSENFVGHACCLFVYRSTLLDFENEKGVGHFPALHII